MLRRLFSLHKAWAVIILCRSQVWSCSLTYFFTWATASSFIQGTQHRPKEQVGSLPLSCAHCQRAAGRALALQDFGQPWVVLPSLTAFVFSSSPFLCPVLCQYFFPCQKWEKTASLEGMWVPSGRCQHLEAKQQVDFELKGIPVRGLVSLAEIADTFFPLLLAEHPQLSLWINLHPDWEQSDCLWCREELSFLLS